MTPLTHLLSHLTIGLVVPSLLFWAIGSLVLLVARKASRRSAVA
jgi:hypothetical protein